MQHIADHVGVSRATVSLVLNGGHFHRVSKKTRERIERVAEELNYTPNLHAQALSKGSTNSIGVVAEDFSSAFVSEYVTRLSTYFLEEGFMLFPMISRADTARERKLLNLLPQNFFAGMICIEYNHNNRDLYESVGKRLPLLVRGLNIVEENLTCPYINVEYAAGIDALFAHLKSQGVVNPAVIGTTEGDTINWDGIREGTAGRGYAKAMRNNGFEFDERYWRFVLLENFHENFFDAVISVMGETPRPDALILHRSDMAPVAYSALRRCGLEPGKDVKVAATDDIAEASLLDVPLTVLGEDIPLSAALAAKTLVRLMNGDTADTALNLPVNLKIRESTDFK